MKTILSYFFFTLLFIGTFFSSSAQLITSEPAMPLATDNIIITFDASEGNQGLQGFTGDVYAHTGVITDQSSSDTDWKYVIADWGVNVDKAKMSRVSTDLYQLEIGPDIKTYYGVPDGEEILKMAFVFRSATEVGGSWKEGKTAEGKDIYVEVYQAGLSVSITSPEQDPYLVDINQEISVEISANEAETVSLYIDNELITEQSGNTISHTHTADEYGKHWIKAIAENTDETAADSTYFYVMSDVVEEALPEGTHYGVNYIDENTVTLSFFAPHKEHVFAIGDFSDWQLSEDYFMKKDGDIFWTTITGLTAGEEYIFQYLIDGELRIADPYTEKTSDPWNDKWIDEFNYPDLIEYPDGKTNGIASVLQTAKPEYDWEVTDFTPPAKENLVIYELHIRDFVGSDAIKSVTDSLNYLENLGVNAIELMPINEFEGNDSWGYNPSFYFAPDKAYGTEYDYKRFIDECHKRGMAVIIDMVLNHSYGQSPLVQMYFDADAGDWGQPTAENPWYNQTCPHSNWCWGYDFDHESVHTQQFIDSVNTYWLTEYKVDGFRFDFTKGFTNNTDPDGWNYDQSRVDILKRMADEIWEANPDAYLILEHLTDNSEEEALSDYGMMLWGNMNYNYNEATMGWNSNSDLSWASYKERGWSEPHLITYMESHDEERLMYKNMEYGNSSGEYDITKMKIALQRVELAGCFFFTIPGPKMIWQFGELGYDYSIDHNGRVGRKPIKWDYFYHPERNRLYQVFSALINLKKSEEAFTSTDFTMSVSGKYKRINIAHSSMDVTILGNFDVEQGSITPSFSQTGDWYEFFSGETLSVSDVNAEITLEPGEYRIYTTKQLETPQIIQRVPEYPDKGSTKPFIYPNPAHDFIRILNTDRADKLLIYNMQGQLIKSCKISPDTHETVIDISALAPNTYLVSMSKAGTSITNCVWLKR